MDNKLLLKIMFLVGICVTKISLGMMTTIVDRNRVFVPQSKHQRHIIKTIEGHLRNEKNIKLLEHSCFKGESFRFQNDFFKSMFRDLPKKQKAIVNIIVKNNNESLLLVEDALFSYHKLYRKDSHDLIVFIRKYIQNIQVSYSRYARNLEVENKCPNRNLHDVLKPYMDIFNYIYISYTKNDYPEVLKAGKTHFLPLCKNDSYVQYLLEKCSSL